MSPDRFDALARLWAMAPSRRSFLLQVGGILVYSALARVHIRLPSLKPVAEQCHRQRAGMVCGVCGLCKGGKCLPGPDDLCHLVGFAPYKICRRCDPNTFACVGCPKGQQCCSDGCCDGTCAADGACCPKEKQCGPDGKECCRDCEVCNQATGKCENPAPKTSCPDDYQLVKGCCVCPVPLCGGKCCDKPCLDGKCCEKCGLDGAVCCDGQECCRERCVDKADAGECCCQCWEDVTEEEGKEILKQAQDTLKWVKEKGLTYAMDSKAGPDPETWTTIDCTRFAWKSLGRFAGERFNSVTLDGECKFKRLKPNEAPRAGDVVAQPRDHDDPGSQHVGIAEGRPGPNGGYLGIAMNNGGAKAGNVWGLMRSATKPSEGGSFAHGDQLHVYRPQKRKKNCNDKDCKRK